MAYGLTNRDPATRTTYANLCRKHVLPHLGARKLRDLSATEVDAWLVGLSATLSTRALQAVRSCLNRALKRAMARDRVKRNVVELTEVPKGRPGRPSKSLTAQQADGVLTKTAPDRLHHYIVVSMVTGARTEELRALRWEHVHADPGGTVPAHIGVWRSVRLTVTRRPRSPAGRSRSRPDASTCYASTEHSRPPTGWRRVSGGASPASCSRLPWAQPWTRPTSAANSAALSP